MHSLIKYKRSQICGGNVAAVTQNPSALCGFFVSKQSPGDNATLSTCDWNRVGQMPTRGIKISLAASQRLNKTRDVFPEHGRVPLIYSRVGKSRGTSIWRAV